MSPLLSEYAPRLQQIVSKKQGYTGNHKANSISRKRYNKPWRRKWRSSPKTPRLLALDQLLRIEEEGAYIGLLDPLKKMAGFGARDAAFSRKLVAGVTKMRRNLDYVLTTACNVSIKRLDPEIREILRMGTYELVYGKCPSHTMNELVNLAKVASVSPRSPGFTNAILRTLAKMRDSGKSLLPELDIKSIESIATFHSHPTWMVKRWVTQFGVHAALKLMEWNNGAPCYGLRITPLSVNTQEDLISKLEGAGVVAETSKFLPEEFLHIHRGMGFVKGSSCLEDGQCFVQDESAGLVVALLDPQPGERVLDGCAAPGGKTLFAAARMRGQGEIFACDTKPGRLELLASAAATQGVEQMVKIHHQSLMDFEDPGNGEQTNASLFDKVLVDAPCSGSGVLAKRADMRWQREESDMMDLTSLQSDLLKAGSKLVAPGGVLVYSTCSIETDENEGQIKSFLASHPEFRIDSHVPIPQEVQTPEGFLRTLPHIHETDGAFGARLVKEE